MKNVIFAGFLYPLFLSSSLAQVFPFADFPVYVENERKMLFHMGGLNMPQFNTVDFNHDGIQDLMITDRDLSKYYCLIKNKKGSCVDYTYTMEYEKYLPAYSFFVIAKDFNQDGVPDLFMGNEEYGVPGLLVYRGYYENDILKFSEYKIKGKENNLIRYHSSSGFEPEINVTSIDLPAFDDVDGDGDTDILNFVIGGGHVLLYKNLAIENNLGIDTFVFENTEFCYGKFYENDFSEEIKLSAVISDCASFDSLVELRHAGSTLLSFDENGDGLKDLLIGDLTNPHCVLLRNGGTMEEAWMTSQDTRYPSYSESVSMNLFLANFLCDLNDDGRRDLLVAPNIFYGARMFDNVLIYKNTGETAQANFVPLDESCFIDEILDFSAFSTPSIIDENGDGLLDIIVGYYGKVVGGELYPGLALLRNTGTLEEPEFTLIDENWKNIREYIVKGYAYAPTFGDVNGDGYTDMIIGDNNGRIHYFQHDGSREPLSFSIPVVNFMDIDVSEYSIPQVVDVNRDGLGDLIIGEERGNADADGVLCSSVTLFLNVGEKGSPLFNPDELADENNACWGGLLYRDDSRQFYTSPYLFESQGKWHFILGTVNGRVLSFRNVDPLGNEVFVLKDENFGGMKPARFSHPRLADFNEDGRYEVVLGDRSGGLHIYQSNWNADGTIPVHESAQREVEVYPNPFVNSTSIKSSHFIQKLELYSIDGHLILTDSNVGTAYELGELPQGVYIVKLHMSDKSVVTKKLVSGL